MAGVAPRVVPGSTAAAHHISQFVQSNPYSTQQQQQLQQQQQQQALAMQRQLGQSHLPSLSSRSGSSASGSRGGSGGVPPGGQMLPPARPPANMRVVELQEKRKQEAEKRRREQEAKQKAAKDRDAFFTSSNLFEAPTKVVDDPVSFITFKKISIIKILQQFLPFLKK